jgi:uncharacterized membrane protein YhaH (DUF805 family)
VRNCREKSLQFIRILPMSTKVTDRKDLCIELMALARWAILAGLTLLAAQPLAAQDTIATLQIGSQTYSNVTIESRTPSHVNIKHANGYASIRVKGLEPAIQQQLGYEVAPPKQPLLSRKMLAEKIKIDPEVREAEEKLVQEVQERIRTLDPNLRTGILAGAAVGYLFFCFCCMLICKKTSNEPGILVWLPVLQVFPLLRAAGMSGWWFFLFLAAPLGMAPLLAWQPGMSEWWFLLVPLLGLNAIVGIVWSVRICQTRGKSGWLGLLFLLPVTNLFVFLYLAFSNGSSPARQDLPSGQFKYQR